MHRMKKLMALLLAASILCLSFSEEVLATDHIHIDGDLEDHAAQEETEIDEEIKDDPGNQRDHSEEAADHQAHSQHIILPLSHKFHGSSNAPEEPEKSADYPHADDDNPDEAAAF